MELLQFDRFAGDPIRVVIDDQARPWFVAVDVLDALHLSSERRALSFIESALMWSVKIAGADRRVLAEQAVYTIADEQLGDRHASAFRQWVHDIVMPAVRARAVSA